MEIGRSAGESAKRIVELDEQCKKLHLEKIDLKEEVLELRGKEEKTKKKYVKVKDEYVKLTEKCDSEKRKLREEVEQIREICRQVEAEKKKLEIDFKGVKRIIANGSVEVAKDSLMAEVEHFKFLSEENGRTITTLLAENEALESHNSRLEMGFEAQKQKVLELVQKIQVLERDNGEMEAEICKMKEDNSNEAERQVHVNKLLKSADNHIVMSMKKINELVKRVAVIGAEKRAMEDEGKNKASELTHRIEVLNRENKEMEAKFCLIYNEKIEEFKRIVNESKKKISERIELLKMGNRELEAEVYRVKRERSEEIKKILNEKTTLQEMHEKETSNLVSRSGILEREKRELEAEIREKDERIKFLVEEKECLVAKKNIMEIKTNWHGVKSEVDAELPQQVLPARNVAILSSFKVQNQVFVALSKEHKMKPDVSVTDPEESSDGSIQKREVEGLGGSVAKQAGIKRCKLDGLAERKLVWKNRADMLNVFTDDDYLCMRSVCALYMKYKSLSDSKNRLRSPGYIGFMPPFETRGMVLGELLTSGDPEGGLKKSLAEFEQADPCGLEDCRLIARHHYKELFGIYKNNLDPLFRSGDDKIVDSS